MTGYMVLLAAVWVLDVQLKEAMDSYDLDGDGGIGGAELTPEAERAIQEWASDTGRTLAPIVGIPLTVIWYGLMFAWVVAAEWTFRKIFFPDRSPPIQETLEDARPEDGNPYRSPNVR